MGEILSRYWTGQSQRRPNCQGGHSIIDSPKAKRWPSKSRRSRKTRKNGLDTACHKTKCQKNVKEMSSHWCVSEMYTIGDIPWLQSDQNILPLIALFSPHPIHFCFFTSTPQPKTIPQSFIRIANAHFRPIFSFLLSFTIFDFVSLLFWGLKLTFWKCFSWRALNFLWK